MPNQELYGSFDKKNGVYGKNSRLYIPLSPMLFKYIITINGLYFLMIIIVNKKVVRITSRLKF